MPGEPWSCSKALARLSWVGLAGWGPLSPLPYWGFGPGSPSAVGGRRAQLDARPGRAADVSARHPIASTSGGLARSARPTNPPPASKLTSSARPAPTFRRPLLTS